MRINSKFKIIFVNVLYLPIKKITLVFPVKKIAYPAPAFNALNVKILSLFLKPNVFKNAQKKPIFLVTPV